MTNNSEIYNLKKALEITGGNEKLAIELLTMLIQQLPAQKADISQSLNDNDIVNLKQHVHKLHGSSKCCGTTALSEAARDYETALENQSTNLFAACNTHLLVEIDRVLQLDVTQVSSGTV